MVEMASSHRLILATLDTRESTKTKRLEDKERRDSVIARILAKPGYATLGSEMGRPLPMSPQ